ncbi:hypothetical protein ADUPG1_008351, partial [Aduncisulcus paluster]
LQPLGKLHSTAPLDSSHSHPHSLSPFSTQSPSSVRLSYIPRRVFQQISPEKALSSDYIRLSPTSHSDIVSSRGSRSLSFDDWSDNLDEQFDSPSRILNSSSRPTSATTREPLQSQHHSVQPHRARDKAQQHHVTHIHSHPSDHRHLSVVDTSRYQTDLDRDLMAELDDPPQTIVSHESSIKDVAASMRHAQAQPMNSMEMDCLPQTTSSLSARFKAMSCKTSPIHQQTVPLHHQYQLSEETKGLSLCHADGGDHEQQSGSSIQYRDNKILVNQGKRRTSSDSYAQSSPAHSAFLSVCVPPRLYFSSLEFISLGRRLSDYEVEKTLHFMRNQSEKK